MSALENGGFAFPWCGDLNECPSINLGMTVRDYFASNLSDESDDFSDMVKERLLGRQCPSLKDDTVGVLEFEAEFRAKWRYMRADAMLKARSL